LPGQYLPLSPGTWYFEAYLNDNNLSSHVEVDSAGLASYHIGEQPDHRSVKTAAKHGIKLNHPARTVNKQDFYTFNYIIVMDSANLEEAERRRPTDAKAEVQLMRKWDSQAPLADVPDPYYGDMRGFEDCYTMLDRSCEAFLGYLKERYFDG
jgi:protein-tyrosine-phosphatase